MSDMPYTDPLTISVSPGTPSNSNGRPTDNEPTMVERALALVELSGALIFPNCSIRADGTCTCPPDRGCVSPGKCPMLRNWQARASSEPRLIRAMWRNDPLANIGILTGKRAGFLVIDIDDTAGATSLAALEAQHGALPITAEALTPSGRHLFFAYPTGLAVDIKTVSRVCGIAGVDVRADRNGQVVGAGSLHKSGLRYKWRPGHALGTVDLAELPAWLLELVTRVAEPAARSAPPPSEPWASPPPERLERWLRGAVAKECAVLRASPHGVHNDTINDAAYSLAGYIHLGLDVDYLRAEVLSAAIDCGHNERRARRTIESGISAGKPKHRQIPEETRRGWERTPAATDCVHSVHSVQGGGDSEEWPEPIPLGASLDLPEFPVGVLPGWLEAWTLGEAQATQTPSSMSAVLALCTLAVCCAKRLRVHVLGGWFEPLNLFACVVLPPGNRKSAVFRDATAPLSAYEREQAEALASKILHSHRAVESGKKRLARAIDRASKVNNTSERFAAEHDARVAQDDLATAERAVIVAPRLTCSDVTQEALAKLLQQQGERIAVMDAEGCGPIALMLGRYSDGNASVDLYLRAHAGDEFKADRVGREPVVLRSPAITLAITVQPEVLRQLGERRELRGLGLLGRVLWCLPASTVGHRNSQPPAVLEHVQAAYERNVRRLLELPHTADPQAIELQPPAWAALRGLIDRIEAQLGAGGELEYMADWAAKLAGTVARIAGLLHAAEFLDESARIDVSGAVMVRAITIGEYFLAHARAALSSMGADPELANAEHILAWLRANKIQQISRRDLHRALRGRFSKAGAMEPAFELLIERGWIRWQASAAQTGPGRPASRTLSVNPTVWDTMATIDRKPNSAPVSPGQNGHNPNGTSQSAKTPTATSPNGRGGHS